MQGGRGEEGEGGSIVEVFSHKAIIRWATEFQYPPPSLTDYHKISVPLECERRIFDSLKCMR